MLDIRPFLDIDKLRWETDKAIGEAEAALEAASLQQQADDLARLHADRAKADHIMSQLPQRCGLEARAGKRYAIVMSLRSGRDYEQPYGFPHNVLQPHQLNRVARMVYDDLQALNRLPDGSPRPKERRMEVKLEHWHDGVGVDSGFNLIVSW